jgi:WhiB family redox-sensing transcriptional regulator
VTKICHLPGPVADVWEWQFEGSCRSENPDVFFHPDGERGPSRRNRDTEAKAVCQDCPVLQKCREHALQVREPYGVWGGMTESEREDHYVAAATLRLDRASIGEAAADRHPSRSGQGAHARGVVLTH